MILQQLFEAGPGGSDNYAENLAQQVFNVRPNLRNEDDVLNIGYKVAVQDLASQTRAVSLFSRDQDFPSDFVSAYYYLQKQKTGVAEGFDKLTPQQKAHEYNLDSAQREMDRRDAEGEDMTGATINKTTYKIVKPKEQGVAEDSYKNSQAYRADGGANDENHEQDQRREQQEKSGTWYIRLNGKLMRDKQGNPYSFRGKAAANKAAVTMQAKLFNKGKEFMLTTNPNDKPQGVAEGLASKTKQISENQYIPKHKRW